MAKILFVPLNTNHVLIFNEIIPHLGIPYGFLCHDRVSGDPKYCTEKALKEKNLPFLHFPEELARREGDNLFFQVRDFFGLKRIISDVLDSISPRVVVLAVDNDPISNIILKLCRRRGIRSVIVQEGSARPDARFEVRGLEGRLREGLRLCGIQTGYVLHGMSGLFDKYLVAGRVSREALEGIGVPAAKIVVTGQPKYDPFMKKAAELRQNGKDSRNLLFAAGFSVIANPDNRLFLRELVQATGELGIGLTVKLHPRSSESPAEVGAVLDGIRSSNCEIIKKGDQGIESLVNYYGLITVASTMVTEALILDREGILVNYLAGGLRLPYDGYDATHSIEALSDVRGVLRDSLDGGKPFDNKRTLLEDMLFHLDGESGRRVAKAIESLADMEEVRSGDV